MLSLAGSSGHGLLSPRSSRRHWGTGISGSLHRSLGATPGPWGPGALEQVPAHCPGSPIVAPAAVGGGLGGGRTGRVRGLQAAPALTTPVPPSWTASFTASSPSSRTPVTPGRPRTEWPMPTWPVGSWLWPTPSCCSGTAWPVPPAARVGTARCQGALPAPAWSGSHTRRSCKAGSAAKSGWTDTVVVSPRAARASAAS